VGQEQAEGPSPTRQEVDLAGPFLDRLQELKHLERQVL
jgi:hypothetical protein